MITKRIIPCLDVRDGRVVKGVNFEGLRDVSSPVELGKYYSDAGADELVFYDITASGGVSTLEDIRALRDMGLYGAILGKAMYNGAIKLKDALDVARG